MAGIVPGMAPPAECLVVQLYRFAARLGGGVGELLAMLMPQLVMAMPTWGQPRCLPRSSRRAQCKRKIVHEVEISTAECCDALADLLPD